MLGARKCSDRQAATYSSSDRLGMQGQPGQPAKSLMSDLWERDPKSLNLRCVSLGFFERSRDEGETIWPVSFFLASKATNSSIGPICKAPNRLGKLSIMGSLWPIPLHTCQDFGQGKFGENFKKSTF